VLNFLAFASAYRELAEKLANAVTQHATPVASGTVARTKRASIFLFGQARVRLYFKRAMRERRITLVQGKPSDARRREEMPNIQQAPQVDSGLGKLIAVGMVLLLPVLGLALLMPAVQSARESARRKSLEYGSGGYKESVSPMPTEATRPQAPPAPAVPRAIVKKYDAEISLTPKLSVGTKMPESIYVADFKANIEAQAPKDGQGNCQLGLPLPPQIISLGNLDVRVNGQTSESLTLDGNHLVWQGSLNGKPSAEITVAYSATGTGVYTLEKPSGKIIEHFRTRLIANRSNIRMLELSLQPNSLEQSSDTTTYTWDYKRLVEARPIAIDVLGIAALDRLGELTWLGPLSVLVFGILVALIALAHDPDKLNAWLAILVTGCYAAAYPMMYFLQDFIDLYAAIALATAFVVVVIAWRVISLFGLRRGFFGGIILPVVLMGLTISATIQAKPATQGVALTIMGAFALVSAMTLLPRVQANLARNAEGRSTVASLGPAIA
jgi:hypothetical protein